MRSSRVGGELWRGSGVVGCVLFVRRRVSEFIGTNLNLSEVIGLVLISPD